MLEALGHDVACAVRSLSKRRCRPATLEDETVQSGSHREESQECLDEVGVLMSNCHGIEVKESRFLLESGVTLDELHKLKRWDDDFSLRSDPPGAMAPSDCFPSYSFGPFSGMS